MLYPTLDGVIISFLPEISGNSKNLELGFGMANPCFMICSYWRRSEEYWWKSFGHSDFREKSNLFGLEGNFDESKTSPKKDYTFKRR
jgi:hypothetical protein